MHPENKLEFQPEKELVLKERNHFSSTRVWIIEDASIGFFYHLLQTTMLKWCVRYQLIQVIHIGLKMLSIRQLQCFLAHSGANSSFL